MNNLNKFAFNPVNLDISRSRFSIPFDHKTTLKSGDLVPFYIQEVTAGDTFEMNFKSLTRMLTPVVPTMDNLFQDVWFFFVPNRLCTTHVNDWQKITGENFSGYWAPSEESTLWNTGNAFDFFDMFKEEEDDDGSENGYFDIYPQSLASYLGVPIGDYTTDNSGVYPNRVQVSKMPFIAYWKIWNEYFRDENTQAPIEDFQNYLKWSNCNDSKSSYSGFIRSLCRVNKIHDLFTDCLPAPQKGPDVGVVLGGLVPVISAAAKNLAVGSSATPVTFKQIDSNGKAALVTDNRGIGLVGTGGWDGRLVSSNQTSTNFTNQSINVVPDNLYVNIDNSVANVNGMRIAFAYQRFLEKSARGGSRFREYIKAQFNISVQEGFVQVPEYLGGHRFPLMISQVLQTFENTGTNPLGTTGAWSNTFNEFKAFTKSFTEQGFIVGLTAIRPMQSYSQMLPKYFSRDRIIDWYHPTFANIGEQALLKKEVRLGDAGYQDGKAFYNNDVFGYQEAWYDYRYKPNYVSGLLAPQANSNVFKVWTYCNYYSGQVVLNSSFKVQTENQVANTLYDTEEDAQFILEAFCDVMATRPMPLFSIPGLIDHH